LLNPCDNTSWKAIVCGCGHTLSNMLWYIYSWVKFFLSWKWSAVLSNSHILRVPGWAPLYTIHIVFLLVQFLFLAVVAKHVLGECVFLILPESNFAGNYYPGQREKNNCNYTIEKVFKNYFHQFVFLNLQVIVGKLQQMICF